ncbi:hypothetical protein [Teichococcus oryzae]|jgi:hypothetical protein|uniref:Uncharacterized protein n=1 Tax=Teichococcus oryzae TaxID=1608942 RepID=A0A5B2TFX9_9PROT|nr:hypothetical protein [Pseudoroseomonas oryzae]KAA2213044.1 hypothetical protein F0Q34_10380 [Pseudoroseomonas oryzae]
MAARLWSLGSLLVAIGLAAWLLGWDTLLWIPQMALEALRDQPWTAGIILAGLGLMLLAKMIGGGRRG